MDRNLKDAHGAKKCFIVAVSVKAHRCKKGGQKKVCKKVEVRRLNHLKLFKKKFWFEIPPATT